MDHLVVVQLSVLHDLVLLLVLLMDLFVIELVFRLKELIKQVLVANLSVLHCVFKHLLLSFVVPLLSVFSFWILHGQEHLANVGFEGIMTLIIVALIVDLLHRIATFIKFLVVAILVTCGVDWALQASLQAKSLDHLFGEVGSISLLKRFGKVHLDILHVLPVVLHHDIPCLQVHLLLIT